MSAVHQTGLDVPSSVCLRGCCWRVSLLAAAPLQDMSSRFPDGLPLLDPVNDMGVNDPAVVAAIQQMSDLEQQLAKNPGQRGTLV